ncbi:enoyl-CoA hydratase/isomerase family protein, partial [bacterium]|nr:enoyl-CoA hydratase/isomerase family protein [bacterium]
MSGTMSGIDVPTERKGKAPLLRVEEHGDVMVVVLDRPGSKVNLIDEQWLAEMTEAVARAEREKPKGFVLRSAKPANFVAGADVDLIASIRETAEAASRAAQGQELLNRIEDLPCLTLAAINGACLGGGLELALAFDTRIVADDESIQMGLPEVRLGILPGFAGTWRLPRRLGITTALPLILAGKSLRPKKALRVGLVDRIVAREYLERTALEMAAAGKGPRRAKRKLGARLTDFVLGRTAPGKALLRRMTLKSVRKQTGGHYPAPLEIVDRVLEGYGAKRAKALAAEAQAFGRLAVTPVAKNLLFLFRGNEALGRHPWAGKPAEVDRVSKRAAVIGAGTMGGGIAGALAKSGLDVRLKDVAIESLRLGMAGAAAPLNRRVKKRALTPRERDAILARISPTLEDTGYGHV